MARSSLALCVVLAISGCGADYAQMSEPMGGQRDSQIALEEEGAYTPDIATSPSRALTSLLPPKAFGLGYFWIGYTGTAVGTGEFKNIGSGDGFSFGTGFKVSETSRSFLEIVYEKTLKHSMPEAVYFPDQAGGTAMTVEDHGMDPPSGYHERMMFGGRSAAAAKARLEHQPRAYTSYGICYNEFRARSRVGDPTDPTQEEIRSYKANGTGVYLGFGVEFPFAKKASVSFDTKYHHWRGRDSLDDSLEEYGTATFSMFYLARF